MRKTTIMIFAALFGLIFLTWIFTPIIASFFFQNQELDWKKLSMYGDTFGVFNSIFSGLAFLGVVFSIIQQQHEMFEQKKISNIGLKITILSTLLALEEKPSKNYNKIKDEIMEQLQEMKDIVNKK